MNPNQIEFNRQGKQYEAVLKQFQRLVKNFSSALGAQSIASLSATTDGDDTVRVSYLGRKIIVKLKYAIPTEDLGIGYINAYVEDPVEEKKLLKSAQELTLDGLGNVKPDATGYGYGVEEDSLDIMLIIIKGALDVMES